MNTLAVIVEFFGTFLLLISIFATGNALVIGGTLALIIIIAGGISGGHMNPAVSVAMWLNGGLSVPDLLGYLVAQYAGGAAALYAYRAIA